MDSDISTGSGYNGSSTKSDFCFAFNNSSILSDRELMIEFVPDLAELKAANGGCSVGVDWARKRKRRREEIKTRGNDVDRVTQRKDQEVNYNVVERDDGHAEDKQEKESAGKVVESTSGNVVMSTNHRGDDEASEDDDSSKNLDSSKPLRVRTLHINSSILAAQSPLFSKLFSNCMKESEQRHVTVQIHASEEAALMDVLNFMYSNTLSATNDVRDVLVVADKFEVESSMRYCSLLLQNQRLTTESALFYLNLPINKSMADAVRPLTDSAKQFLARRFKDITKFQEEVLSLLLSGIEAVLSSDNLQIASEDAVYDFALKWARKHYPKLEERREVWTSHLCYLIRFPCMTCRKLKKIRTCKEWDPELASKLVLEALFYKAEEPYQQRAIAANVGTFYRHRYVERSYKFKPVKTLEFEMPHQRCVVYLDLTRDECARLCPAGRVCSQAFHLGGQGFFLSAHCEIDEQNAVHCFGLFVGMQEKGLE